MDHVVRQRLNEIRQKQMNSLESLQTTTPSGSSNGKLQYLVALGGVAAGFMIAVIAWLTISILTNDGVNTISSDSHVAIHASEIRSTNQQIGQLNERVATLTESISDLETRLKQVSDLANSINDTGMEQTVSPRQHLPDIIDVLPAPVIKETASDGIELSAKTDQEFTPTHIVKTRLNLRPSMSLDTTPVAILQHGTEVEYIHEDNGWYYVNTETHGKGWCAAEYLSPLAPTR